MATECVYCGHDVEDETNVPAVDDDAAWTEIARQHATWCEWVETRAHRLPEPNEETP